MTTIIKNVTIRNRHFTIVKNDDGFYCGIEDKYIDKDGRLNRTLNGFQMHANKDINETIKGIKDKVEMDYLESQGHSKAEAFCIVFDCMDMVDMVAETLAR